MKAESTLFRIRFDTDSADERQRFLESLNFDWQPVRVCVCRRLYADIDVQVSAGEKNSLREELTSANPTIRKTFESEAFYKVSGPHGQTWTCLKDTHCRSTGRKSAI